MSASFAQFASEHTFITMAAYASLILTVLLVLWFKFTELVQAIWSSVKNAIRDVLDFRDELKTRKRPA